MLVYMIVATEDSERLSRIVKSEFSSDDIYILPKNEACFVAFNGNTSEISKKLDLSATEKKIDRPCPAIISRITTYGGFAPSDLWEWLNKKLGA